RTRETRTGPADPGHAGEGARRSAPAVIAASGGRRGVLRRVGGLPRFLLPAKVLLPPPAFLDFVVLSAHNDLYKASTRPFGWPGTMRTGRICFNLVLAAFVLN